MNARGSIFSALLLAACGPGEEATTATLTLDLQLPPGGVSNVAAYNLVVQRPAKDLCEEFSFLAKPTHTSTFESSLTSDVAVWIEGIDTGGNLVQACGGSLPMDLTGGGEFPLHIYFAPRDLLVQRTTAGLAAARSGARTAALPDGRVLLVGGQTASGPTPTLRLDLFGGTATTISGGPDTLLGHTVSVLPDGELLVVGGEDAAGDVVNKAWLFAADGSSVAELSVDLDGGRAWHSATVVQQGRVLIAGGVDSTDTVSSAAWLLDPHANPPQATPVPGALATAEHSAVVLEDGRVLIVGGRDGAGAPAQAWLYDPKTNSVALPDPSGGTGATQQPQVARTGPGAVRLNNGAILLIGGHDAGDVSQTSMEAFVPDAQGFLPVSGDPLSLARFHPVVTTVIGGNTTLTRVLVGAGGVTPAELIEIDTTDSLNLSASHSVTTVGSTDAVDGVASLLLEDGSVLLVGGTDDGASTVSTISAFRPCPRVKTVCPGGN